MRKSLFLLFVLSFSFSFAEVTLPKVFGDNMVLQRDKPITIWGWAAPKEKISIQFNKQTKNVSAGKDGQWKVILNAEPAGGPYQLIAKGKNTVTISNVRMGDVWICSGQSNMEWTVKNSNRAVDEIKGASYPTIRHFKVPNRVASSPQKDLAGGEWKVCSPETVGDFTAVGYFFARELTRELNVPIGLVNTSWGGTHVETWTSREAFEGSDEFRSMIAMMPKLNLDSLAKLKAEAIGKRIQTLQGSLPEPSTIGQWKDISYDDSQWKKIRVPGLWEYKGLEDFDGVVWFRRSFTLSSSDLNKDAIVELGMIDDADDTFVNGAKIGSTQAYNEKRIYKIPAGVLKEGRNVIAVRVNDTGGGGGIYGDDGDMKLTVGNTAQALNGEWSYRVESISKNSISVGPNSYPTLLYNAMIKPLIPLAIKGAIWYQGESNAGRAYQYRKAFPLMISDWRQRWGQGDFPFYFVQLASFNSANGDSQKGSTWAELREAQAMTLALPNTGMAITTDIGEANDIHPRNKQDVGKRLAAIALSKTYNKNNLDAGPVFKSIQVRDDKAFISFTNVGSGLVAKDKYGYLRGFEIAGADKQFKYAKAYIDGDKVVVYNDDVKQPLAVRFGWADEASDDNLFNKEGFPAAPFRTDNWKGITEEAKFIIGN